MRKIIIMVVLALTVTFSSAAPIRNKEKKEARREHRLIRKKFDNRSREQKLIDLKIFSAIVILGLIVFKRVDDSQ